MGILPRLDGLVCSLNKPVRHHLHREAMLQRLDSFIVLVDDSHLSGFGGAPPHVAELPTVETISYPTSHWFFQRNVPMCNQTLTDKCASRILWTLLKLHKHSHTVQVMHYDAGVINAITINTMHNVQDWWKVSASMQMTSSYWPHHQKNYRTSLC